MAEAANEKRDDKNGLFRETAETLGVPRAVRKSAHNLQQTKRELDDDSPSKDLDNDNGVILTNKRRLRIKSGLYDGGPNTPESDGEATVRDRDEEKQERAINALQSAMDTFEDPGERNWFDSTWNKVSNVASSVWDKTTKAWDKVSGKFTSLWEDAKKSVTGATDYVGDSISNTIDIVSTTATNAWDSTTNFVSGSYSKAKNWLFGAAKPETAANTNTPAATPVAAPVPEAMPLVGSENDIDLRSGKSITAQFRQAANIMPQANNDDIPKAGNDDVPEITTPPARVFPPPPAVWPTPYNKPAFLDF